MIIYWDEQNAPLRGTPGPLRERRAVEWINAARQYGIVAHRFLENEPGAVIDVSQCERSQLLAWLNAQGVVCCDLHQDDVSCLLGNPGKLDVFLTTKQLANEVTERLVPDELIDTVQNANWKALSNGTAHKTTAGMSESQIRDEVYIADTLEEAAAAELKAAGVNVPDRPTERAEYNPGYDSRGDDEYGIVPDLFGE